MIDIARLAGVSPMTVSRAFKADGTVSEATQAAVMKAAEDLGYVFDSTASALRSQRSDFVAVTIPSINNANFADTVRGLSDGLRARGLQILLGYTDYDVQAEETLIAQLLRRRPEAMVVTGGTHTDRSRALLDKAAIPVIEIWDLPDRPIGHVVGFSNAAAMGTLVDHLVSQGRRRIAFIGGDAARDTRGTDRRRGFVAAMQRHGLDTTRLIDAGPPPISMAEGAAAMADLLARLPDTDAVVCVSDLSAFGALTECQRQGVDVPGRVAIAGFGDYEIAAICVPPLTTIDPFPRRIGSDAASLILQALDGTLSQPATIRIAPELLTRASSSGA
ncbi:LacI family DNA-binding transcriptional regulator (plasmid) [Paracoccus liaowanqingii]|uniref:LacI family DNA-binding transcriptional regulator n=1 Tax=Paracoccus liaowanqingii TaxID=2560053 RepID=A0A4Y5SUL4_9RHOB|nr:LacI family DNA-binding transcriptional regulator [Paracoccus liaowanqingii]QDA37039.1 LacI family DNA-binding transcriptional regulator [Paracoccus liaowanqingii]